MTAFSVTLVSRLLDLPEGVDSHLLSFVVSGTGGLQAILSLRLVCSTTKLWVDNLPQQEGKSIFSRAQVRMDSRVDTLKRFLHSAPPFEINSLSLDIKKCLDLHHPSEKNKLWNSFTAFWAPKLESLELRNEGENHDKDYYADTVKISRRIFHLLESPNLLRINMRSISVVPSSLTLFPSSFYKVIELRINRSNWNYNSDDEDDPEDAPVSQDFYSELMKNPNLRILETFIHEPPDFESLQKFIDTKKDDPNLKITLNLLDVSLDEGEQEVEEYRKIYTNFVKYIVATKSTIRLRMLTDCDLQNAQNFLPKSIAVEILERVESAVNWAPEEDSLFLLNNLPLLKKVGVETKYLGGKEETQRRLEELTFPPSLEELSFSQGIYAIGNLPEALQSLTLESLSCNMSKLVNSLTLLKKQCPLLMILKIKWEFLSPKEPVGKSMESPPGFTSLRSLTFEGDMDEQEDAEIPRAIFLNGFHLQTLRLLHLALCFKCKLGYSNHIPVLDVPTLNRLCFGPVGDCLLVCDIQKTSVSPDGLTLLEKLESLASANVARRQESEGRGSWQRLYRTQLVESQ